MRRLQNEEACLVLLAILRALASDPSTFIHKIALKGGILMAGELRSPRSSADIDATAGRFRRLEPEEIVADLRRAGREFNVRQDGEVGRSPGGTIIHLRFDSLTDAGMAKLEISVREDLIFAVRDAFFDVSGFGLEPFSVPALSEPELVAEKIRALIQRAQPRDLYDLRFYLVDSGWHLEPGDLRRAVDAKLSVTRYRVWRPGLWRRNLDEIQAEYARTLTSWIAPERLPAFGAVVDDIARRLQELRLD